MTLKQLLTTNIFNSNDDTIWNPQARSILN